MKATEIIRHFEGHNSDATEIVTSAEFLESLGWDFSEYDRTEDDEVIILIQAENDEDYETSFHLRPANSTYTVEGYEPTGGGEKTLKDISENLDSFYIL